MASRNAFSAATVASNGLDDSFCVSIPNPTVKTNVWGVASLGRFLVEVVVVVEGGGCIGDCEEDCGNIVGLEFPVVVAVVVVVVVVDDGDDDVSVGNCAYDSD